MTAFTGQNVTIDMVAVQDGYPDQTFEEKSIAIAEAEPSSAAKRSPVAEDSLLVTAPRSLKRIRRFPSPCDVASRKAQGGVGGDGPEALPARSV